MNFINIILLPLHIMNEFFLKRVARFILKEELNDEKNKLHESYKMRTELREEIAELSNENKLLNNRLLRIKYIIENNKSEKRELLLTKKGEIVSVIYRKEEMFDTIYLLGENSDNSFYDSKIDFQKFGNDLKIVDFVSKERNRGYGRALIEFALAEAREADIKKIYGDLSPQDSDRFEWLIPFYESLGFQCQLFNDKTKRMDGLISMELTENARKLEN
ncbi:MULTISPECIES: GNAT family N-acetyltransferase [Olivibacter]|uniref:N-acetyltransferase domain-containing protein n=1 Tax=Olivibacter jilunii TaxID=985016 RepID=A0ABW6B4X0_9SPHI|nr:GNAT family N-acetyltransferase [Pseudosphingobacterium sp.]